MPAGGTGINNEDISAQGMLRKKDHIEIISFCEVQQFHGYCR